MDKETGLEVGHSAEQSIAEGIGSKDIKDREGFKYYIYSH